MTTEERIQLLLGIKDVQIASLSTQLEQANDKIKELEAKNEINI